MRTLYTVLTVGLACCATSPDLSKDEGDVASEPATSAEASANHTLAADTPPKVDFDSQVQPILVLRCSPCHFSGGVMYERRPFDRAETIYALGEKLLPRIKDADEQRIIREFLAQGTVDTPAGRS